tara:strand:+ start:7486 stop:7713 length:228 start_codon:yes stop_codon:yes gene_type:complete
MPKAYKIINQDGQFARIGEYTQFSKQGKIWVGSAAVKLHMNYSSKHKGYPNCEIVEYEMVEVRRFPAKDWMKHGV